MTFQIGMVGSDGVLLASDTLHSQRMQSGERRSTFHASKINIPENEKLAYCCSGDDLAEISARIFSEATTRQRATSMRERLLLSATGAIQRELSARERRQWKLHGGSALFAYQDVDSVQLWVVHLHTDNPVMTYAIESHVAIGDPNNSAVLFVEKYFPKERVPVDDLVFIAAHTVLMAASLNPSGVDGLEIVLCRRDGFSRINSDRISSLKQRSKQLDSQIAAALDRNPG